MFKEENEVKPLVGIGTFFDVSGHKARVTAIKKDGVEVVLENVPSMTQPMMVDFEQIEKALFRNK